MIGELRSVVLDCPDPRALARFYQQLLGGELSTDEEPEDNDWVVLTQPGGNRLAFQLAPGYRPPVFPDPAGSQQFHLDVLVTEVEEAERQVLAIGGTRIGEGVQFRVYTDPVGHPFCLVWF
ncbi:VOC family protein [Pseudonocardiaceae bacterium YIM PH 21723]|nr:VOC family protein [Pseudonocardiaceae bacterium YIM PH 21723]